MSNQIVGVSGLASKYNMLRYPKEYRREIQLIKKNK